MVIRRYPMRIDTSFKEKLENIQKKIMMKRGKKVSMRELTKRIVKSAHFTDIENQLLDPESLTFNIGIKFDKRKNG